VGDRRGYFPFPYGWKIDEQSQDQLSADSRGSVPIEAEERRPAMEGAEVIDCFF
jgi:hypothetical protein